MYAEFRHLDGALAGEVCLVPKEFVTIGRHPSADIRFDAHRELDVSGRHAAVFRHDDRWILRDLGSTNGTWINGVRIRGDHTLSPGDELRFGANGPRVTFRPEASTPGKIRVEVRRQTAAWKRVTIVAIVAAAAAALAAWWR